MMSHIKKRIITWIVITIGFSSITAQVLFMRELVVIFYGNELSMGVMLGVWLFFTAMGSGPLAKIIKPTERVPYYIAFIQITLVMILPLTLTLARSGSRLWGMTPGEMIGFIPMLLITMLTLAPICLLSGLLYTLACELMHRYEVQGSKSIGKVYLFEALGAGLGGLMMSYLFVRLLNPIQILFILCILNMTSAILLHYIPSSHSHRLRTITLIILTVLCGVFGFRFSSVIQGVFDKMLWKGYDLILTKNTMYGNITVTRLGDQISFFQNGLLVFTAPDKLNAEESVHFSLLEHPEPKRVLMIGGGLGGGIQEALGHPSIQRIDYVELDPNIVALSLQCLPADQTRVMTDPRLHLHHMDGRRFIKRTSGKYDVVILNLPNPYTAQLNRFYTHECFREVADILQPGGVFSLQVTSAENAIGPELSNFLSTLATTLQSVFMDLVLIPGETCRFIVSNQRNRLTPDPHILIQRLQSRNLKTLYVREYYIPYKMSRERLDYLLSHIHTVPPHRLNSDFKPVGYFYDTILWATSFSTSFKKLYLIFADLNAWNIAGFFAVTAVVLIFIKLRKKQRSRLLKPAILYSILCVGFTEISLEVALILGFQVLHGYVYHQLAIIVAGYMVGLAMGSYLAISKNIPDQRAFPLFRILQFNMILYPLFLAAFFYVLNNLFASSIPSWTAWLFPCLTAGAGFLGGFQFPLANRLYLRSNSSVKKVAGFLYASDLLGSSVGALFTSAFLIPLLGLMTTLLLLSFYNACSFLVLMMGKDTLHKT